MTLGKNRYKWPEVTQFFRRIADINKFSQKELRQEKAVSAMERLLVNKSGGKLHRKNAEQKLRRFKSYLPGAVHRREQTTLKLLVAAIEDLKRELEKRIEIPEAKDPAKEYNTFMDKLRQKASMRRAG